MTNGARMIARAVPLAALVGSWLVAAPAFGQGFTIEDTATSTATATTSLAYEAQNNIAQFTVDLFYDETALSPQTAGGGVPEAVNGCLSDPGANWDTANATSCNLVVVSPGQIRIIIATGFAGVTPLDSGALANGVFGSITWDVTGSPGNTFPITVTIDAVTVNGSPAPNSTLTVNEGSVTINAGPGGFYSSTPAPGGTLDLGTAVVNSAATPVDTLTVTNASADPFDVTGFANVPAEVSTPGGTFTVPGSGGSVTFDGGNSITCTPDAVGTNNGTFDVTHDANGGAASPVTYNYTCEGLAPNVQVAPTTLNLAASIGGTAPTATFDVSNTGTADAQNASVTDQGGSGAISITDGLTNNVIAVGETDSVEVSCDTTSDGTFNETIRVMWDDPVNGGQAMQDVTVECIIANVAPGYSSAPAPGSTINFTTPFGTPSTQTINIGNENAVGTGAGAELNVTGATLSNTTEFSIVPASPSFTLPAGATNGTESIDVTCTPPGVGTVPTATLTVQTNDGDQSYNLDCEGTGDALTSTPPDGGSLNLGTVAPGTTTPPGSIAITNNTLDSQIDLSCAVTGDTAAFGNPASPIAVSIAAGATNDTALTFQCTPPSVGQFSLTLSCTTGTTALEGAALTYTVNCSGRPLVVPTLSNWGLLLMALFVLGIGGLVGRRMMA